tara:strand:+ start:781 stop:1314 length:534 start_codon:yes stop_codon:yes gene_type:complete
MQKFKEYLTESKDLMLHVDTDNQSDWEILPVALSRDSGLVDTSNWDTAVGDLKELDGFDIHRFNHWACGWYEIIIVRPGSEAYTRALELVESLENYPLLDEEDHNNREYEATIENIGSALIGVSTRQELPSDISEQLFSWFFDNDQSAVEPYDGGGGYPSDEQIVDGLTALKYTIED